MSYKLYISGDYKSLWLHNVKVILDQCGLSYIWENQNTIDSYKVKCIINSRIDDIETQKWYTSISVSPMCNMYHVFKRQYGFENYLLLPDSRSRILITKLRCRNLKLPVKTSVYLPISNVCTLCNENKIGDEYHYLFVCPAFNNCRSIYIKKYFYTRPTLEKARQFMCISTPKHLNNLGKFLNI